MSKWICNLFDNWVVAVIGTLWLLAPMEWLIWDYTRVALYMFAAGAVLTIIAIIRFTFTFWQR